MLYIEFPAFSFEGERDRQRTRKEREEERRKQERIRKEKSIQEEIDKENEALGRKLRTATDKEAMNARMRGRERRQQRAHVEAELTEDDAEGIQFDQVISILFDQVSNNHAIHQ